MVETQIAHNALSGDDQCPICFIQWYNYFNIHRKIFIFFGLSYRSNFIDPSIVAILPCYHACCATCLLRYHKACEIQKKDEQSNDDDKLDFSCVLCRKMFKNSHPKNCL